jgi:LPPG:FO 2-phospho-L-lactate transferase
VDTADAFDAGPGGPVVRSRPLLMTDVEATAAIAADALRLAGELAAAPVA